MWLCFRCSKQSENTHENSHRGKKRWSATNAIMQPMMPQVWGDIKKLILVKDRKCATNVILHPYMPTVSEDIWNIIQGKKCINATNAIMHLLKQTLWEDIWKFTQGKKPTFAMSVIMRLSMQQKQKQSNNINKFWVDNGRLWSDLGLIKNILLDMFFSSINEHLVGYLQRGVSANPNIFLAVPIHCSGEK